MIQATEERVSGEPGADRGNAHAAPWDRVAFAPPADWVAEETYDAGLPAKEGDHVTHLLWSRQMNAGAGRSFHCTARRLETSVAVQHLSQWRLELDPRTQRLTVHWLRLVRDGRRIDHLQRERMRLIQRESQLERLVIDGAWTLLAVLDDVRPGDILEAAYSYETRHPIRADGCEAFFVVPPHTVVGRYRFRVLSEPGRTGLAWRASADAPERREETLPGGERCWSWEGTQTSPREEEANQPETFLDYVWMQVSDLADWSELSARTAEAWAGAGGAQGLEDIPAFARPACVDEAAVNGLVSHIQETFRYLSINLETGGWIPAAPGLVARRRHGDCKDLSWLAATVLRGWGLAARPVLVGTGLREQTAALLPMAGAFDHAILEVEAGGKTRWFDLTANAQGGDFDTRMVGWFGRGLTIEASKGGLHVQPGVRARGVYAFRETILLDTNRGALSVTEHRVRAEGWQADNLRRARQGKGAEEFAKDREERARARYGKARRAGELQWRDDRERNVCELVEVFELEEAVYPGERDERAVFDVPPSLVVHGFALPPDKTRRGPWDMPFPLELTHEITVKSLSLGAGIARKRRWQEPEFEATLECPMIKGAWTKTVRFSVGAAEVAADRVPVYRRQLDELFRELGWKLYLPWGYAGGGRAAGFGQLGEPASAEAEAGAAAQDEKVRAEVSINANEAKLAPGERQSSRSSGSGRSSSGASRERSSSGRRRSRRSRSEFEFEIPWWTIRLGLAFVGLGFGLLRGCMMADQGGP